MTTAFTQELLAEKKIKGWRRGIRKQRRRTHQQHGLFVEQLLLQDLQVPLLLLQLPADVLLPVTNAHQSDVTKTDKKKKMPVGIPDIRPHPLHLLAVGPPLLLLGPPTLLLLLAAPLHLLDAPLLLLLAPALLALLLPPHLTLAPLLLQHSQRSGGQSRQTGCNLTSLDR